MRLSLRSITLLFLLLVGYVETHADTVKRAANVAGSTQDYPAKPVRVVSPYPPGSSADIIGRIYAPKLTEALGRPFIVDNRSGASGKARKRSRSKG